MEDEWEREIESEEDLNVLFVTYRDGTVSAEQLLGTIRQQGFEATVLE